MSVPHLTSLFDIGASVLGSTLNAKNGAISVQTGDAVNNETRCDGAEWWQHVGFASRPAKAIAGKSSCQTLAITQSRGDVCFASRDIRGNAIYGSLAEGETSIYAGGPNNTGTGRSIYKDDGSVASITHLLQLSNSNSGLPILIQMSTEGKINLAMADKSAISMDSDGIKMVTTGTLNLGSTGAMALIGETMALNAGSVSLGANASKSIALAPDLITWATAVTAYLLSLNIAITLTGPSSQGVTSGTPPSLAPTVASTSVKAAD